MKKIVFTLSTLCFGFLIQCSNPTKDSDESLCNSNAAVINIKKEHNIDSLEVFPAIPKDLSLGLHNLVFTEGSITSLQFDFEDTIDNVVYSLHMVLPSGEKLGYKNKEGGGILFECADFPCTITGEEYNAHADALEDTPLYAESTFIVNNLNDSSYNFLFIGLEKLVINKLEEEDYRLTSDIEFVGKNKDHSLSIYGDHKISIALCVCNKEMRLMSVD